jgi:hypothetical protein
VITEGAAVSVPALPPIDLPALQEGPSEDAELESSEDCGICYETFNVDDLVKCASDSACTKSICHDCLIRNFLRPWKLDGGRLTNYDPTKCPYCLTEGAFSLDETDAAIVDREVATMYSEMHTFEEAPTFEEALHLRVMSKVTFRTGNQAVKRMTMSKLLLLRRVKVWLVGLCVLT